MDRFVKLVPRYKNRSVIVKHLLGEVEEYNPVNQSCFLYELGHKTCSHPFKKRGPNRADDSAGRDQVLSLEYLVRGETEHTNSD